MKKIFYSITFAFFLSLSSVSVSAYDIDINSDALDYDQSSGIIEAKGHAIIKWQGKTLSADFIEFLFDEKQIIARGNVKMEDESGVFFADNMLYYYDAEKGELEKAYTYSGEFYSYSQKVERLDEEHFAMNKIRVSNCDLDEPHSYFKASRASLRANKRITLYNALLFVGEIPIFYFPVITKSLAGGKQYGIDYSIEPGYTKQGGIFIKNTISYGFSDALKARAFLDYLGDYGYGYGGDVRYDTKKIKASVSGYKVYDEIEGKDRWAFSPYIYAKTDSNWLLQSQGQFLSDEGFNKIFNRNEANLVVERPRSYISVSKNAKSSNISFLFEQYQKYQVDKFVDTSISLPKISYTHYPKNLLWGIIYNYNVVYEHAYRDSYKDYFYKNTANSLYTLSRDIRLGRRLTLKPSVGVAANWYDLDDSGNTDQSVFASYITSLNARMRITQWMDWNVLYNVRTVGEKNSLRVDSERNDYGLQIHNVVLSNFVYIGDRTTIKNYAS
ncbi:MAG: hypothetical protein LBT79_06140 [Elusimicrobiota bacterium]|jgi:LPS-assembly protein|nr:hypothetical protein [Elusimicrobiota bacterium]